MSKIEILYDPENDTRRDGPPVTWAEYDLYWDLQNLIRRVERLEAENDKLKKELRSAYTLASGESLE